MMNGLISLFKYVHVTIQVLMLELRIVILNRKTKANTNRVTIVTSEREEMVKGMRQKIKGTNIKRYS